MDASDKLSQRPRERPNSVGEYRGTTMVRTIDDLVDAKAYPSNTNAVRHPGFTEAGLAKLLRGQSSQHVHSIALLALGPHGEVLHSARMGRNHPNVGHSQGVGQAVVDDEASIIDPAADAIKHDNDTDAVADPSTSRLGRRSKRQTRSVKCRPERVQDSEQPESRNQQSMEGIDTGAEGETPIPEVSRMKSFWMHEEDKVKDYLYDRIECLQQLSDKRISKAWIKGICPRKQAIFPYRTKKRKRNDEEDPKVPGWWPDTDLCPFKEPDHVKKDQRNALMLHLLRLRPSPERLKAMNGDNCEPHNTHMYEGWTALLQEHAPVKGFLDDLEPKTDGRPERRRQLLQEIYEVAEKEELYISQGMNEHYHYKDVDKPRKSIPKKSLCRAVSVATSRDADGEDGGSRASSTCGNKKAAKRRRQRSEGTLSGVHSGLARQMTTFAICEQADAASPSVGDANMDMDSEPMQLEENGAQDNKPHLNARPVYVQPAEAICNYHNGLPWHDAQSDIVSQQERRGAQLPPRHSLQQWQPVTISPETSFASSSTEHPLALDPYQAYAGGQSLYPGNHDYSFAHYEPAQVQQQPTQLYQAHHVPQPQFDTVPNTPVFSPTSLVYNADQQQKQILSQPIDPMRYGMTYAHHNAGPQRFQYPQRLDPQLVQAAQTHPSSQQYTFDMDACKHRRQTPHIDGLPPMYNPQSTAVQYQGFACGYQG